MKVKEYYFAGRAIVTKRGDITRLWHDPWYDNTPLKNVFPG